MFLFSLNLVFDIDVYHINIQAQQKKYIKTQKINCSSFIFYFENLETSIGLALPCY